MTGQEQIAIVRHVPYSVLKKLIKHHKGLPEVMPRLLFIRLRYKGVSVAKVADTVGVSGQTGYNWQERWNADRFDGWFCGMPEVIPKTHRRAEGRTA